MKNLVIQITKKIIKLEVVGKYYSTYWMRNPYRQKANALF